VQSDGTVANFLSRGRNLSNHLNCHVRSLAGGVITATVQKKGGGEGVAPW
jgi:hypothetical protein